MTKRRSDEGIGYTNYINGLTSNRKNKILGESYKENDIRKTNMWDYTFAKFQDHMDLYEKKFNLLKTNKYKRHSTYTRTILDI